MAGDIDSKDQKLSELTHWMLSLPNGFQVLLHIVTVIFVAGEKRKELSKTGQYIDKTRCNEAIKKVMEGREYVYDNQGILYLPEEPSLTLTAEIPDQNGSLEITITFKLILDMKEIVAMRTFLNTALNQYPLNLTKYSVIGKGKVYETKIETSKEAEFYKNYGLVIRHGNSKGVQFINNNTEAVLAMDYKKAVFYPDNANFLNVVKKCLKNKLSYEKIAELYRNVVLQVKHRPWECFRFSKFTDDIVENLCVELQSTENEQLISQSMVEYYRNQYSTTIDESYKAVERYPKCKYPLETLILVPDQKVSIEKLKAFGIDKNMKRLTVSQRYEAVKQQRANMKFDNPILNAFGIKVSNEMIKKECIQLRLPSIVSGDTEPIQPTDNGTFKIAKYLKTASIKKLFIFGSTTPWIGFLKNQLKIKGIYADIKCLNEPADITNYDQWIDKLASMNQKNDHVIVITKTQQIHDLLKFLNLKTGVRIQHILEETTTKKCIQNIIHKLNVKAGGFNWEVDFAGEKLNLKCPERHKIIIAVDVCRPLTKQKSNKLSDKAACVGIVSNSKTNPNGFDGSLFYQKAGQEPIFWENPEAPNLFYEKLMKIFRKFSRNKEADIIFTRDGVSENQYADIIKNELPVIKKAADDYFGPLKYSILALVVTKSGNTRFFNTSKQDTVSNLPPRSIVAVGNRDTFEQFHVAPHFVKDNQGTTKTFMVTVLENGLGAEMEEIQNFLLALCNLHQYNCGPIGLPAPIFMADKIAYVGHRMLAAYEKYIAKKDQIQLNEDNPEFYKQLTDAITQKADAAKQQP